MKIFSKTSTAWIISIVAGLVLSCGQRDDDAKKVDFTNRVEVVSREQSTSKVSEFRIAVASILSAEASFDLYDSLLGEVAFRALGVKRPSLKIFYPSSYKETYTLFEKGKVDLALVCSALFVYGKRSGLMEALVVPVKDGKSTYQSYLVTAERNAMLSWDSLLVDDLVFSDPLSLTGYFYPLSRIGIHPSSCAHCRFSGSHDRSLEWVKAGIAKATGVDGLVFDDLLLSDPERVSGLKIVERSQEFPIPPVVVHRAMPKSQKLQLGKVFIELKNDVKGARLLAMIHTERFEHPPKGYYEILDSLVPQNALRNLRADSD